MSDLKQTDLSKRLREAAATFTIENSSQLLMQAADEIERYYTGMLNWKATAEAQSRTQPEVTAPAQDLSAAILAITLDEQKQATHDYGAGSYAEGFDDALAAAAALASSANALSAGDRVDAEPLCFIDPHRAKDLAGGENVLTTLTVNRAFPEDVALYSAADYMRHLQKEFDAYMNDGSAQLFKVSFEDWRKKRAAILQSQKAK